MRNRTKFLIGGFVAVLISVGVIWWFVFRDTAPEAVSLTAVLMSYSIASIVGWMSTSRFGRRVTVRPLSPYSMSQKPFGAPNSRIRSPIDSRAMATWLFK